jgi:hypothetical protein
MLTPPVKLADLYLSRAGTSSSLNKRPPAFA